MSRCFTPSLDRRFERRDRVGRLARLPQDERQVAVRVGGVRAPGDDLLVGLHRLAGTAGGELLARAMQHLVEIDQTLRVVGFGVPVASWRRTAARVAERAQPLSRRRGLLARLIGERDVESAQHVQEHRTAVGLERREILLLARIALERS